MCIRDRIPDLLVVIQIGALDGVGRADAVCLVLVVDGQVCQMGLEAPVRSCLLYTSCSGQGLRQPPAPVCALRAGGVDRRHDLCLPCQRFGYCHHPAGRLAAVSYTHLDGIGSTDAIKGTYLDNYKQIWDLYITDSKMCIRDRFRAYLKEFCKTL